MNITVLSDKNWLEQIKSLYPNLPISAAIRQAAMSALDSGIKARPFTLPSDSVRTAVALMTSHESKLKLYAVQNSSTYSHAALVSYLANAWLINATAPAHENKEPTDSRWYDDIIQKAGMKKRKEQADLIENLRDATESDAKTSLHEASTGVGKTMAMLLAAIQAYQERLFSRIVIAVPTQAILKQFEQLTERLELGNNIAIGIARAKNSYLSHFACESFIDDEATPAAIKVKLQQIIDSGNYRASELAEFENEINMPDLLLHNEYHDDDLGGHQYERERECWHQFNIIITTHSMIAMDSMFRRQNVYKEIKEIGGNISYQHYTDLAAAARRKGSPLPPRHIYINNAYFNQHAELIAQTDRNANALLPYYDGLFIDEAHAYPDMIALSLQSDVSLFSLKTLAGKAFQNKAITQKSYQQIQSIWAKTSELFNNGNDTIVVKNDENEAAGARWWQEMSASIGVLETTAKRCAKSTNPYARRFMWQLNELISIIKGVEQRKPIEISFSPVQKYPRLTTYGANETALSIIHFSWLRAKHTAYLSATLSLSSGGIGDYTDAIARLILDRATVKTYAPIMTSWLTSGVTIDLHHKDRLELTKAKIESVENKNDANKHYPHQAKAILDVANRLLGGHLVLCTSYYSIHQLQTHLKDKGLSIVCSSPSRTIGRCIEEFTARYHAGEKVVWLATGAAWVGLDLTDNDAAPEHDRLIQSLHIQQLPYPSQNEGNKNNAFIKQQSEAVLKMKQGIGRLVRREGRSGMEIHILDGRIHERAHSRFLRLLQSYQQRK